MNENPKINPSDIPSQAPSGRHKKSTSKQKVAIAGIILLVALYLVTLLMAFVDNSASGKLFALCLFASMAIPMLIWIYTWLYGKLTEKKDREDFS